MKRWILVLVLGCQGGSNPNPTPGNGAQPKAGPGPSAAPAPTAGCDTVGEGVKAIWDKQVADADNDQVRKAASEMRDKVVARLVRHCKEDGWRADAIQRMRGG